MVKDYRLDIHITKKYVRLVECPVRLDFDFIKVSVKSDVDNISNQVEAYTSHDAGICHVADIHLRNLIIAILILLKVEGKDAMRLNTEPLAYGPYAFVAELGKFFVVDK